MEKLLKTTQDHHEFLFWVATLQSGVLPKGTGLLQSATGYCCLGVGVACTIKDPELDSDDYIFGCYPGEQWDVPSWLNEINDYCEENFKISLTLKNDSPHREGEWSHKKIGNWLLNKYKKGLL